MRVSEIWVFPVKSARGLSLPSAEVGDRGFVGDRRFMLVNPEGHFLTQRTFPKMALIDTAIERDRLRLSGPGLAVEVALRPTDGEPRRVEVWGDEMDARSLGPGAAAAFSAFLDFECELVYMPDESERPVDTDWAPPGHRVGFADGFPYLLITTASLAELARRGADVPMIRFRPNLVVEGAEPFAEDGWGGLRIGEVRFRVVKPCERCSIPTVNPATGEFGDEPTRTLITFRKREGKVLFGQNLIAESGGVVRVGDEVTTEA